MKLVAQKFFNETLFQSWSLTWCLFPFGARHPIRLLSKRQRSYSFGLEVIPPLPVPFDEHLSFFSTSLLSLRLCYMYAHMGMHTWVYTFARSPTASALAVLQPRQPPFLLGPCASPLSHYFSGYRPSHFKRAHLFRDALPLRRDLLVSRSCLLPSSERRNSSILCLQYDSAKWKPGKWKPS